MNKELCFVFVAQFKGEMLVVFRFVLEVTKTQIMYQVVKDLPFNIAQLWQDLKLQTNSSL